jgi:Tol biopolymer transport system component
MVRRVLLAIIGLLLLNPISARSQTATPTPPPGGGSGLLLYITKTDDGAEVFSSTVDGEQRTQLTTSRNPKLYPQWSPDGKQFLYEEIVGRVSAVFVKAADADAAPKNIVNGSYPRWMPDGKQIILAIDGGGTSIYVKNADGTGGNQIIQRAGWVATCWRSRANPARQARMNST